MKSPKAPSLLVTVCLIGAVKTIAQAPHPPAIPLKTRFILNSITASELRGDLSFIASDTLQGRYTPSPGLDAAAGFIASRFRAAGLESGGNGDYFQVADMVDRKLPNREARIELSDGSKSIDLPTDSWEIRDASEAADLRAVPVVFFPHADANALKNSDLDGKAVMVHSPDFRKMPASEAMAEYEKLTDFNKAVANSKALAEIVLVESHLPYSGTRLLTAAEAQRQAPPVLLIKSAGLHPEQIKTLTLNFPAPEDHSAKVKNVIAILRGSDPRLSSTCVLLTAHYDHIGTTQTAEGLAPPANPQQKSDHIYNGANDDGSGTVSVIAIAGALAKTNPHPRRSIVFMTFFGEERGELGSKFYGKHPLFPISKTVADINLEQVGRTDSTKGKQINTASLTGYDYSDVTKYLERAGAETGVKVYKDDEASDAYFTRSDNDALAEQGVPAHSLTVAFDYPDYHGLGDEWQKVDYENMARVDRMIALGLLNMANSAKAPEWNAQNPKTAPFREAQQKSLGH